MIIAPLRQLFRTTPDSLVCKQRENPDASMRWFPWINLVWSVWLFVNPLYTSDFFGKWLWPTLASYVVFLVLFQRFHYGSHRLPVVLAIAALGFILLPWNPGSQCYIIYACAFFPFCMRPRAMMLSMAVLLAAFSYAWHATGIPMIYMVSTLIAGPVVALFNIGMRHKMRSDAQLRLSHEEVRRLAALAERERIGRDLHDLLGHTLSLITLKSELAVKLFDRDPLAARREIVDVERVARDALGQVRRAVSGIRTAGLGAELASARLLLESGDVRLDYALAPVLLPVEIETALALIVREAVTNIQRHARASQAVVEVVLVEGEVRLTIRDDGVGATIVPGNGLNGMRERLGLLDGRLEIESARGRGTRLGASIPMPQAAGGAGARALA